MGIRFFCPNGHKLNVKTFLAGKRGICPNCDARFVIPLESGGKVTPVEEELATATAAPSHQPEITEEQIGPEPADKAQDLEQEQEVWHIRSATGVQQGPLSKAQLHEMISAGQVERD